MAGWIDTHCHITDEAYRADRREVITRMAELQVDRCVTLGVDIESSMLARNLAYCHPTVIRYCAGVHPHDADRQNVEERSSELERLWNDPYCIAIGEIGLDFFRDYASTPAQERNFRAQLLAAKRLNKPVVIHNRNSETRILELLDETRYDGKGIFHCFSGDEQFARDVVARGFYVSFAGNITYEKSTLVEVAKTVPLDKLLIETDAPWLTPAPNRKQRNEPANVAHTGAFLSNALGIDKTQLMLQLTANFNSLFR